MVLTQTLTEYEILVRLLISLGLGAAIGLEREIRESAAGLRTNTLVCLGATLFTLVSINLFSPGVDITRIAAQVVVGIGFIGGGVIFREKNKVLGLSTAATLWVVAAIGLLVGIGDYFTATLTTGIALLVLIFGTYIEKSLLKKTKTQ